MLHLLLFVCVTCKTYHLTSKENVFQDHTNLDNYEEHGEHFLNLM